MSRHFMGYVKGIGAGLTMGIAVAAVGTALIRNNHHMKKRTGKCIRAVSDLMDNVHYMMK